MMGEAEVTTHSEDRDRCVSGERGCLWKSDTAGTWVPPRAPRRNQPWHLDFSPVRPLRHPTSSTK